MNNFIKDYVHIGIGFIFRQCPDCGNIRITLSKDEGNNSFYIGNTCISKEAFEDEDMLLAHLAEFIKELHNPNFLNNG